MAEYTYKPGERQAQAIQQGRKAVHEAQVQGQAAHDALHELERCLLTIIPTDDTPELQKLLDHVQERLRKLNSMELGSFMIRVHKALEQAWGKLP